jgi:hypothetical protein
MTLCHPSPEHLVEIVQYKIINTILDLLKMNVHSLVNNTVDFVCLQRDRQQPEDLIQLWEDYRFMAHCESMWSRANPAPVTWKVWNRAQQILLAQKVTRTTIQILEAIACVQNHQA